jgi:asparagine N-glycosylation enzyme membrane subunit Stt3
MGRAAAAAWGLGIALAAVIVRSLALPEVLVGDRVVLQLGDAYYHARLALHTLLHWPSLLRFDPLVAFPGGSWVPWPPLHDLLLAAAGRAFGGGVRGLELAAAWLPPALGALTVAPVYASARRFGGRGFALAASALFAALPIHVVYSVIGNPDHHCSVSFLGACWLAAALTAAAPGGSAGRQAVAHAGVAGARLAMLLTFPGSFLYLVTADGALWGVLALAGRARALVALAVGLIVGAFATALAIPALGPPVGGVFSGIALSWLHVVTMVAFAALSAACATLERVRPAPRASGRAARAGALAAGVGALLLTVPGLRASVLAAAGFVGQAEPWAASNAEQLPIWFGGALAPLRWYGGFAYAIPLVPLAALSAARAPRLRDPARVLAIWTTLLGGLAALQVRYGADYAPAAAVGFALAARELARALRRALGARGAALATGTLVALAALPMLGPPIEQVLNSWRAPVRDGDPLLATATGTLYRFAERVRAATPETAGFDDPGERPAYGILASPNVGHVLHWVARRATATDNFGPYGGSTQFAEAYAFERLGSEAEAVALARRLEARFVLTMEYGRPSPGSLAQRLHRQDGLARGAATRWERFRLIDEGPSGGLPLTVLFGGAIPANPVPYKLYEVVEGAVLEVAASPGDPVEASLMLATPTGRRFLYRARGVAEADGVARLRVPYATETDSPVRPHGPWRVEAGDDRRRVTVSERAVRLGERVPVPAGSD